MSKIKSQSFLCLGELIDKPPKATMIYDAAGESVWTCPHCGALLTEGDTDCLGAEPDCMFCNKCSGEFEA